MWMPEPHRDEDVVGWLVRLVGGPQDGLVVRASGNHLIFMLDRPHQCSLLETPSVTAVWNPEGSFYGVDDRSMC